MSLKLKSCVQALDPVSGIWLSGRIVLIEQNRFKIKWTGYSEQSFVAKAEVRSPIIRWNIKLQASDWKSVDIKSCQRGDKVVHKNPNGTKGNVLTISSNDPWNCEVSVSISFLK